MAKLTRISQRLGSRRTLGQTLALMAIALPVVVGGVGFATDVGNLYYNYYKAQTGVDASVLSAVSYLGSQSGGVTAAEDAACNSGGSPCLASSYGYLNGIGTGSGVAGGDVVTFGGTSGSTLAMQVQRTVPYYFSRVIGVDSGTLNVSAVATIGPAGSVNETECTGTCSVPTTLSSNLVPIGLQIGSYTLGQPVNLVYRGASGSGPQFWGGLILGATGASAFGSELQYGFQYKVSIGDTEAPETGAKAGPTASAIQARLSAAASDPTYSGDYCAGSGCNITPGDPRAVTVPLVTWDPTDPQNCGSGTCTILGFASIWIQGVGSSCPGATGPLDICGVWVDTVGQGTINPSAPDYGTSVAKLTS